MPAFECSDLESDEIRMSVLHSVHGLDNLDLEPMVDGRQSRPPYGHGSINGQDASGFDALITNVRKGSNVHDVLTPMPCFVSR